MKKLVLALAIAPMFSFALSCKAPWQPVPAPNKHIELCRLEVPKGWLVYSMAITDIEIPNTTFIPDENHEWVY